MKKPGIILGPLIEVSMFEIIRSFVSRGIEVIVFDNERSAPGFYLRGISEKKIAPDPEKRPQDFVKFLLQLGKEYPGYVLLTNDDLYNRIIAEHAEELKKSLLILISEEPINAVAADKVETVAAALKCGVPIPETYNITDNIDNVNIHFPLLIKPRKSGGSRGQYLIKSRAELVRTLGIIDKYRENYIAQEWILGKVRNLCTFGTIFDKNSKPKAFFTARRLSVMRSKHINQGITTYLVSERIPELIELSIKFLKEINWQGIAELEYKFDERDSKFKLLEINPRIWSWTKLPAACGVDFAKIYYELLCGKNVSPVFEFRTGVTYLRSIIDMYSSFYKFATGENKLNDICKDLYKKYSKIVFNPKDNLIDELPWKKPNFRFMLFYLKKLKKYG
jgi:predicted ATP-grasp superfamily ATP-dependent carboligase